jgi:hypothetical protein
VKIYKSYFSDIEFTMKMNSDNKFNLKIAFKISSLLYSSYFKNLIDGDLSGAKAVRAPSESAAAIAAPPPPPAAAASAAAAASTAAAASAAAASAAATSATSAVVSVRAVKIFARLIERNSDTRSRSCASQHSRKGSPGFSLLSERHGEGAVAHCLELSSQALGLF